MLFLFLTEPLELSKQLTRNAISQPIGTATTVDFSTHGMVLASRPSDAVCFCSAAEEKGFAQLVAYRNGSLKQLCDAMRDVWIWYRDLGRVIQQTDKNDSFGPDSGKLQRTKRCAFASSGAYCRTRVLGALFACPQQHGLYTKLSGPIDWLGTFVSAALSLAL